MLAAYDAVQAGRLPFCWPGLLFPQIWFLYRKLYVSAAFVTVAPLALAGLPGGAYLAWVSTVFGAFGLRVYVASATRLNAKLRAECAPEQASILILRAGGVSRVGAMVGALYIFAVFVMTLKPAVIPVPVSP